MASLLVITLLTIVRLMRTVCVSSRRRYLTALGTSRPVGPSRSTMNPRSAWRKMANRQSSNFGNTSASPRAWPRCRLISIRAFSFASVLTSSRQPLEPDGRFNFDIIVELPDDCPSSSSTISASAVGWSWRAGGVKFGSGGLKVKDERQVADAHLVVLVEQLPLGDGLAVEKRAVPAVQIFEIEIAVDVEDPGVLPADGGRFQHHVAGRVPTEGHRRAFQGQQLPRIATVLYPEYGHANTANRIVRG